MKTLNEKMEFDCPVRVSEDGTVETEREYHAPVVTWSGSDEPYADQHMVADLYEQGWTVLDGYSGQYSYAGPIMHESEYVGGGLERDILDEPGVYVVVTVADLNDEESEPFGWMTLRKM